MRESGCDLRVLGPLIKNLKSKIENGWGYLSVIAFVLVLGGAVALAQQPAKVPRIGVLAGSSASGESPRVEAFRQGLRELGYVEGKNIAIEYRYANARFDKLPALVDELIRLKVDVVVASTTPAVQAAKNA